MASLLLLCPRQPSKPPVPVPGPGPGPGPVVALVEETAGAAKNLSLLPMVRTTAETAANLLDQVGVRMLKDGALVVSLMQMEAAVTAEIRPPPQLTLPPPQMWTWRRSIR